MKNIFHLKRMHMYNNILVPIDIGSKKPVKPTINNAQYLLTSQGKITVLNVIKPLPAYVGLYMPTANLDGNTFSPSASGLAEILKVQKTATIEALKAHLIGITNATVRVITGKADSIILEYAKIHEIDCIVLASHKPNLTDYFLGSTASHVVRFAQCAVHVLR